MYDTTTIGNTWVRYETSATSTSTGIYIPINNGYTTSNCGTSTLNWNYNYELYRGTGTSTINYYENECLIYKPTLKENISNIIKSRCSPMILTKRKSMVITDDVREQRARETLKRIIGKQKFIGFIKHGFISVKGKSGLVYQIFPGSGITHVFEKGTLIERLCVVLKGNFPPTDSLIMRFLLILNNEQQFRSLSIKHSVYKECSHQNGPVETKPLAEIFNLLKNKVA